MAAKANAKAVGDGVACLAAPHALLLVESALFSDPIADGSADPFDPRGRERRGDVEGGVDLTLEASESVGASEAGRAAIESLSLYFKGFMKLSHALRETIAGLLVGTEVLDLSGQGRIVLLEDCPVHAYGQF